MKPLFLDKNKHSDGECCCGTESMGYLECDTDSSTIAICKAFIAHKKAIIAAHGKD